MARRFLIIDGYNLMHAAGYARPRYGPGDLEQQRNRFVRHLLSLVRPDLLADLTVVFDAFASSGDQKTALHDTAATVVFAAPGTDADSDIEERLAGHSSPRQVVVVSSDHRIQKAAHRRRAKCVDSEVFWKQLTTEDVQPSRYQRPHASHASPVARITGQTIAGPDEETIAELQQWADQQQQQKLRQPDRETASTEPDASPASAPEAGANDKSKGRRQENQESSAGPPGGKDAVDNPSSVFSDFELRFLQIDPEEIAREFEGPDEQG
ncbi:MAG: NYN domain-containing protein [Planctomycetaceae bacterium]|nr:NYN domain-containing protein [Planctomycetaceae bacterium]